MRTLLPLAILATLLTTLPTCQHDPSVSQVKTPASTQPRPYMEDVNAPPPTPPPPPPPPPPKKKPPPHHPPPPLHGRRQRPTPNKHQRLHAHPLKKNNPIPHPPSQQSQSQSRPQAQGLQFWALPTTFL